MHIVDLNGTWTLSQKKTNGLKDIKATVPGDVYADLLREKKIPDPYYRDNENRLQWIGESDWRFEREFTVDSELLEDRKVLLCCKGLDTISFVRINGKKVAQTDNMYREYEFDVKPYLKAGKNTISIDFESPYRYVKKRKKAAPTSLKKYFDLIPEKSWLRKEPCNFGWDWGPKLVTAGIWRDIKIIGYHTVRLTDMHITQEHKRNSVELTVTAQADVLRRKKLRAVIDVVFGNEVSGLAEVNLKNKKAVTRLKITDPMLWWPNNMGEQNLYTVTVTLVGEDGFVYDVMEKRIGLRTLDLDCHKDKWGESFQFSVNGKPFFAKGANWIPGNAVLANMTEDDYRSLIQSARDANMNMLRVWGGGIYEPDVFYDLCDEMGICVWQDFMFACSNYPTIDEDFIKSVELEAIDNVKRIRHHASLALWCGNNELEQINCQCDNWQYKGMPWEDYKPLFDKVLPRVVKKYDPQTDYWPSSPHTPHGNRADVRDPKCGDAHLWDVWHRKKPFEWYRTCEHRFNSEFGFQSFPEPATVNSVTEKQDRNVTSFVMEHHQRSGIGNTTIMQYMLDWFKLPDGFDNTLWLSQILQGMAIKYACEHWRRSMPRGMGTLYWQLNDCWPVASWASIDSHLKWKALHYMAKKVFAPILVSGLDDLEKGTVEIHVTSDLLEREDCTAEWELTDLSGKRILRNAKKAIVAPGKNTLVRKLNLSKELDRYGKRELLLWLSLKSGKKVVSENLVNFARPKHLELNTPKITPAVKKSKTGFTVTLKSDQPALWAWVSIGNVDATYSDNFFHLKTGNSQTVEVTTDRKITVSEFEKKLTIKSLVDTYK